MPTEDTVWRDLRGVLPRGHWTRVENTICDPGTPDINFCVQIPASFGIFATPQTIEGWVELKYTEALPLEHPVLATQKIWIRKRLEQGGNVLIAVAIKKTLYWLHGKAAPYVNDWDYIVDFESRALAIARNRRSQVDVQRSFYEALERLD